MKPIKKMVEAIWYKCEICNTEYSRSCSAEWCEHRCKQKCCEHTNRVMDYEVEERELRIFQKCETCELRFDYRKLTSEELETIMRAKILVQVE